MISPVLLLLGWLTAGAVFTSANPWPHFPNQLTQEQLREVSDTSPALMLWEQADRSSEVNCETDFCVCVRHLKKILFDFLSLDPVSQSFFLYILEVAGPHHEGDMDMLWRYSGDFRLRSSSRCSQPREIASVIWERRNNVEDSVLPFPITV